ncbi:hypothetical protein ACFQVD_02590 [Streptosporangium amethystogenes subsp. fukuiense]|uniref:Uncharacterized protein n=1 Tax=Streptosporangium amethystogenes subsp. fukuiense TaxID=698418 RepID=A0ABW2SSL9_9ACTN
MKTIKDTVIRQKILRLDGEPTQDTGHGRYLQANPALNKRCWNSTRDSLRTRNDIVKALSALMSRGAFNGNQDARSAFLAAGIFNFY